MTLFFDKSYKKKTVYRLLKRRISRVLEQSKTTV